MKTWLACSIVLLASIVAASAASLEKAQLLRENGLIVDAKRELIDVAFSAADPATKAEAYRQLGAIAVVEQNGGGTVTPVAGDAVARSWLWNGDFWADASETNARMETRWAHRVEAALGWYGKVIAEFPKSPAARLAYERELRLLLLRPDLRECVDAAITTLRAFEADFPDAPTLEAFRFQVVQAYWTRKDRPKAREWLEEMVAKAGPGDSFYRDLAQRRLDWLD